MKTQLFIFIIYSFILIIKTEHFENNVKRDVCCSNRVSQIASNIALKAAAEAKAAEDAQMPAGAQAAHQVKEQLAEKAVEAAKAAQAALAGKVALVEEISQEISALKIVLAEEQASKIQLEHAINEEIKALNEDKALVKVLSSSHQVAKETAINADSALKGIKDDLQEKEKVLQSVIHRTHFLEREEGLAKVDLENTRHAARKAVNAAQVAKANALRSKRKFRRNE